MKYFTKLSMAMRYRSKHLNTRRALEGIEENAKLVLTMETLGL
jgi:hypothetical protein